MGKIVRSGVAVVLATLAAVTVGGGDDFERRVVAEVEPGPIVGPPADMARYAPLVRALRRDLGRGFACVAVPRTRGLMVVYITGADVRAQARSIAARVRVRTPVTVRIADPAESFVAREGLLRRLRASAPLEVNVNFETVLQPVCPKIVLMVRHRGDGPDVEAAERWAAGVQHRYGSARIAIVRGTLFAA